MASIQIFEVLKTDHNLYLQGRRHNQRSSLMMDEDEARQDVSKGMTLYENLREEQKSSGCRNIDDYFRSDVQL